jgi:hypothetical protein
MFVLLQVYPPEAADHDDQCCYLDVLAVDASKAALESFLADYARRYRAAVAAFDHWDDTAEDWGPQHDHMCAELRVRYDVHGSLVTGTRFKILETQTSRRPADPGPGGMTWPRWPPSDTSA